MEERKNSMLETAYKCFQSTSTCGVDCIEEEWLIHYMLGKISEKRKLPPKEYLKLYKQVGFSSAFVQHNKKGEAYFYKFCFWIYKEYSILIKYKNIIKYFF